MPEMFNDKQYSQVNREERHYCFLLGHALLADAHFRGAFCEHLSSLPVPPTVGSGSIALDPNALEVYVEAAVLRDYWADLGVAGEQEVEDRRRAIIEALLTTVGCPIDIIDTESCFTTSTGKLWSPARWIPNLVPDTHGELHQLRQAFNAKPDVMLVSSGQVVLIEAKVHSPEGRYAENAGSQTKTQRLISTLLHDLVPTYSESRFHNITLGLNRIHKDTDFDLRWSEVAGMLGADIDGFTRASMEQLGPSASG